MVAVWGHESGQRKRHDAERRQRRGRQNRYVFAERWKHELALACGDFGGARLDVADFQPLRTFQMTLQHERLQSTTPYTHSSILRGRSSKHVLIGPPFALEKRGESPGINHMQIRRLFLDFRTFHPTSSGIPSISNAYFFVSLRIITLFMSTPALRRILSTSSWTSLIGTRDSSDFFAGRMNK